MNYDKKNIERQDICPYYPLANFAEAQLLIEQELCDSNRPNYKSHTSTTQIITVLGLITGLLCLAGIQLYRPTNIKSKIEKQAKETVTINPLKKQNEITLQEFIWRIEEQAIGSSIEQKLIDESKF